MISTIVPVAPSTIESAEGAALPHVNYRGGHLLTAVEVYTIFWGVAWQQEPLRGLASQVNEFFRDILVSPLMDLLAEYSQPGKKIGYGQHIGTATLQEAEPGGATQQIADTDIQAALQNWISAAKIPQPTANSLYVVYLPSGVTATDPFGSVSCDNMCGYHWCIAAAAAGTRAIYYAVVPFPHCYRCKRDLPSDIDAITSISSHELSEAITDPAPFTGWIDEANNREIGDICNGINAALPGRAGREQWIVQKEWSNALGRGAVRPA